MVMSGDDRLTQQFLSEQQGASSNKMAIDSPSSFYPKRQKYQWNI